MMNFVVAFVALVGAVALLNLLLTVAVIRRLRDHESRLAAQTGSAAGPNLLPVGRPVPKFDAVDVDGTAVSRESLAAGPALVAFLRTGCQPCERLLPELIAYAAATSAGRGRVFAVVTGRDAASLVQRLGEVATILSGAEADRVAEAFTVTGFPTLYALQDGAVWAAGSSIGQVSAGVPAPA